MKPNTTCSSPAIGTFLAAALVFGLTATANAAPLWTEDFTGLNSRLIETDRWAGVEGLPNSGSLRNHSLLASDDAYGFGFPAAHKHPDGFYSVGGSIYTILPSADEYVLTGNLIDFGTGIGRSSNTSVYIETKIHPDSRTLIETGWEIRLVRYSDITGTFNSLQLYDPDGNRVIHRHLSAAPSEPQFYPFRFERQGDSVQITLLDGENPETHSQTDPFDSTKHHLRLRHSINDFGADPTRFGWSDFQMSTGEESARPYAEWLAQFFSGDELSDPVLTDPNASPAGDGISNLTKYALGLSPLESARSLLPQPETQDGHLVLSFTQNPLATDVELTAEVSADLSSWASGEEYVEELARTPEGDLIRVIVRDRTLISETERRFLRLRTTQID